MSRPNIRDVIYTATAMGFASVQRDPGSSSYVKPSNDRPGKWLVCLPGGTMRTALPHEARKLNRAAGASFNAIPRIDLVD